MTREEIMNLTAQYDHEIMNLDGYEDCCMGIMERCGMDPVLIYDADAIIEKLCAEGMTEEDAREHFYFNIIGSWVGDGTPAFKWSPNFV